MQMLERASSGYRMGYLECCAGKPKRLKDDGTFLGHDYSEGWDACWNDDYWRAFRENEDKDRRA